MCHATSEARVQVSTNQTRLDKSMSIANDLAPKPPLTKHPVDFDRHAFRNPSAGSFGNVMMAWPQYMVDAFQRGVLFLDLLRERGNEEIEITLRPLATVLRFGHKVLMDGRLLPRPINYALSRIMPPPGVATDNRKRPVVVVDPRAGQGPGIGGFKTESEIGDALNAGHPVYFIGFGASPAPGQQFVDVVEGQVKFFERVVELHPDAPRPFAIGNCRAGYQTLMVAMLRPDLFGPCLMAGSPMSYWQGVPSASQSPGSRWQSTILTSRCKRRSRARSSPAWMPTVRRVTSWQNKHFSGSTARHSCRRFLASTRPANCGQSLPRRPKRAWHDKSSRMPTQPCC
jgi:hypothetical protein